MDAIIGRYRARMEETGLVLRHPSGINFDLTPEETLGLSDFINVYKQTLIALERERDLEVEQERETEPRLESVIVVKSENLEE